MIAQRKRVRPLDGEPEPYPLTDEEREQSLMNTERWRRERAWQMGVLAPDEHAAQQPRTTGNIGRQRIQVGRRLREIIQEGMTVEQLARAIPAASRTVMTHLARMPEWHLVPQIVNGSQQQNAPWLLRRKVDSGT